MKKAFIFIFLNLFIASLLIAQDAKTIDLVIYEISAKKKSKFYPAKIEVKVRGKAPKGTISVEGEIKKAVTDNGEDLLPEDEEKRKFTGKMYFFDKTQLESVFKLKHPGVKATGIQEISGVFNLSVSEGEKKADLGIVKIKQGEKLKEFDGVIEELNKKDSGDNIKIVLNINDSRVKKVKLYKPDGSEYKYTDGLNGSSWGKTGDNNEKYYIYFYNKKSFPDELKIVVQYYAEPKKVEYPFQIKNVTLLGDPKQ